MSRILVAQGASRAFTILLLGGAVQPAVAAVAPPVGAIWLALVALTAFTQATRPSKGERPSVRVGATAALVGYLLILPLSIVGSGALPPGLVLATGLTAVVVGGATAWLRPRLTMRTMSASAGEVAR